MMAVTEPRFVQQVRLLDVFVVGPLLIYSATHDIPKWLSIALTVTGIATILYNGARYLEIQRSKQ